MAIAAAAPVLLLGGTTVAGARQPAGYDPVRDTISELAGPGATDSWIMIGCFVLLGACHLATAAVLHAAGLPSRFLLAVGGAATVALIAFPRPKVGGSLGHGTVATIAVLALALWPARSALLLPRGPDPGHPARSVLPWAFRRPVALTATALLLALFGWFVFEVISGHRAGLAERATALGVGLWPPLAVLSARRTHRRWHDPARISPPGPRAAGSSPPPAPPRWPGPAPRPPGRPR